MSELDELAAMQGPPDPIAAAEQLAAILDLTSVGLTIRGARVVGRGSRASVDLYLSDGTAIEFEKLGDVGNPGRLMLEVAACTGATPKIKAPQALRAVALIRALAEHQEVFTADEIASEWAASFLQAADELTLDMTDQAERWAAFARLEGIDPEQVHRLTGAPVAASSTVLAHLNGTRYVRTGWVRAHIRAEDGNVSHIEIAHRLQRIGWIRRAGSGRIKATQPGGRGVLGWTFYEVPADWTADR